MRVRISHQTLYEYKAPARSVTQILRLTPRNQEGQRVESWRIDVDVDCALQASEDAFGNVTHAFSAAGPLHQLKVSVDGDLETFDTAGVARGAIERFPPSLYLRPTPLTLADDALRDLAADIASRKGSRLNHLHVLMLAIKDRMDFNVNSTTVGTSAAEAFGTGSGVCQDFAHVFISCARLMDIPARYISGYFLHVDGPEDQDAGHAWAEAYIEDLGWVGFDPANGISPRESHIYLARGLDYLGAAPVRGARGGGVGEKLSVRLKVSQIDGPVWS